MNKLLVSGLAVCAMAGAAFADPDYRQAITIPSGVTSVTQVCFNAMSVMGQLGNRVDSYAVGANTSITNVTISVAIVGSTYTNTIPLVSNAAGTANTAANITVKQVVDRTDYFIVTTLGATNAVATVVYLDLIP